MNKKKLVYVSPECFSDVDMPIIKELNKEYQVYWIVIFNDLNISYVPKTSPDEILEYGKIYNLDIDVKIRKGRLKHYRNINFDYNLLKSINYYNPDIIYIESFIDIYFSILSYIMLPINKTIIGIHDVIPHVKQLNIFKKASNWLQRKAFKKFQVFSYTQEKAFKKSYTNKETYVIPLAPKYVEGVEFQTNTMTKKNGETIFLFWGTIRYSKGVDLLIEASEKLYQNGVTNFKTVIVGGCNSWNMYKKRIRTDKIFELNIQKIPNEAIPKLLNSAHFLVLPYRDVTQSGPLFFAINYNLPVITSNLDGFNEYIDDSKAGLQFETEDVLALVEVMSKAVNINNKNYLKMKLALEQLKNETFDINIIINRYIKMFNSILCDSFTKLKI